MPTTQTVKETGAFSVRRAPLVAIVAATVAGFGFFWYRKGKNDPSFLTENVTRHGGLGEAELHPSTLNARAANYDDKKFGRKTAERAGLLEGDRSLQGIFPVKPKET
ncbi:hypothetical protein ACKKBG_A12060 [Auxenochlorella protothecoides x Auxenochlorella symbiontica]